MKKFTAMFFSLVLLFTFAHIVSAEERLQPSEDLINLNSQLDARVKKLNEEYLLIYLNYTGTDREVKLDVFLKSDDVVSLRNDYKLLISGNPKLEGEYLSSIGSYNSDNLGVNLQENYIATKRFETDSQSNIEQIYLMEDSSFVIGSSTSSNKKENVNSDAALDNSSSSSTLLATTTISSLSEYLTFGDHNHRHTLRLLHILYPDTKLAITTYFTTSKSSPIIELYNVTNSGSYNQLPFVTVVSDVEILRETQSGTNYAKSAGNYTVTYGGYNGIGVYYQIYDVEVTFKYGNLKDWEVRIDSTGVWNY